MVNSSGHSYEQIKAALGSVLAGQARKWPASLPELEILVAEKLAQSDYTETGVVPITTGGLAETDKELMQRALTELDSEFAPSPDVPQPAHFSPVTNQVLTKARIEAEMRIRTLKSRGMPVEAVRRQYNSEQLIFVDPIITRVYRSNDKITTANASTAPTQAQDSHRGFMEMAVEAARKSRAEDERCHPRVGAVVVKDGSVLAVSYRGELDNGDHAEFTALEKKLQDDVLVGATVYATLEPCTSRNHPKVPCAVRIAERKVAEVFVGILDPNPEICGRGVRSLQGAGIAVHFFDPDLVQQIEEMNRDFVRDQEQRAAQRAKE